jgi:hypothetical protein
MEDGDRVRARWIIRVVRIGRKCYIDRDEIERLIAQGGKRFKGGWRREPKYA